MKYILLLLILIPTLCFAQGTSWDGKHHYMEPYKQNEYGLGINSDATGKPFQWETKDGKKIEPWNKVKPNGYGLGLGSDEYGRPVKPGPIQKEK